MTATASATISVWFEVDETGEATSFHIPIHVTDDTTPTDIAKMIADGTESPEAQKAQRDFSFLLINHLLEKLAPQLGVDPKHVKKYGEQDLD